MSDKRPEVFDITFIGAGPTGLFGAFYAGLRELKVKVIDALPQAGGQLITLYPEIRHPRIPGDSLQGFGLEPARTSPAVEPDNGAR
jgi:thioredoxin reductase